MSKVSRWRLSRLSVILFTFALVFIKLPFIQGELWEFSATALAQTCPTLLGETGWAYSCQGNDVFVSGNYAYIATACGPGGRLDILDVSDPRHPTLIGSYGTGSHARALHISGSTAYVADSVGGLLIIDVSNPTSPVLRGRLTLANYRLVPGDVYVSGSTAYVTVGGFDFSIGRPIPGKSRLLMVDVSNPVSPAILGNYELPDWTSRVHVSGNRAYVTIEDPHVWDPTIPQAWSGLLVIDVSNPSLPVLLGSYDLQGSGVRAIYVSGTTAYVSVYTMANYVGWNGIRIIDISNPALPVLLSSVNAGDVVTGIHVLGRTAYVAAWREGLLIIDVSNPTSPAVLGNSYNSGYAVGQFARSVYVSGSTAHLVGTRDGTTGVLWTLDVSGCETVNTPPIAHADPDQTVNEGTLVTLDGSGSNDPENAPLTYQWVQIAGLPVTLNLTDSIHPTFIAPDVPAGGATFTFELTVNDGQLTSDPAAVNITVKNVNHPPTADADANQAVQEGSPVTLNGAASFDLDGEGLTYSWVQTAGPLVALSDSTTPQMSFTAPFVGSAGATLTFQLTVSDGIDGASDTVNVFVENVNHSPTADAGVDQTKDEGSLVTLNGLASSDPDGDSLVYNWTQLGGPVATLSNLSSPTPSFTAPLVTSGGTTLTFQLTVSDGLGDSIPDEVAITILDLNDPPACGLAQASPTLLWPPNHKLVPIGITGVSDPDNDQVTITVMGATQDEAINGLGDGDTSPDAVIQEGSVLLRAERSGGGNGRVYEVTFRAADASGGSCTGRVTICVPHDRQASTCVDDGQSYDSLQP